MTNINTLKTAIENLTPVECTELQHWLEQRNNAQESIDHQLEADLEAGKIDALLKRAITDHQGGRTKPL